MTRIVRPYGDTTGEVDELGLPVRDLAETGVLPPCGLAGSTPQEALRAHLGRLFAQSSSLVASSGSEPAVAGAAQA